MKILLLISEMWNDKTYPNNNMSNWFTDFDDIEIATVSGGAGKPNNKCCKKYFQVTDKMMAMSIIKHKKVGNVLEYEEFPKEENDFSEIENKVYSKRNKLHLNIVRLVRSIIWRFGRYDKEKLKKFIDDFNPDIIFSQRMGAIKMCRMEKVVQGLSSAPMIAYTGDDEYSNKRLSFSPIFWFHHFWTRKWLRERYKNYKLFYGMSEEQLEFFSKKFGVATKFLVKCGNFESENVKTKVNDIIQIVYAGKFYCGRWKTLKLIADAIRVINSEEVKIQLNIYTSSEVTKKQNKFLNDGKNSIIHGFVSAKELDEIYNRADIALHVEGLDLKNSLDTKYSFSTKIIDCLSSGCAVMAVCKENQSGFVYLRDNDIAITSNGGNLVTVLQEIVDNKNIVLEYSKKAFDFGCEKHERRKVHNGMIKDFNMVLENEDIAN